MNESPRHNYTDHDYGITTEAGHFTHHVSLERPFLVLWFGETNWIMYKMSYRLLIEENKSPNLTSIKFESSSKFCSFFF